MLIQKILSGLQQKPKNIAIIDGHSQMTYSELDRRSTLVANWLQREDKQRIAVSMNRTAEWVIVFIGILRAGKTYIPISPKNDPMLARGMMEDADAQWLIRANMPDREWLLPEACSDVSLDIIEREDVGELSDSRQLNGEPDDPMAYTIFTSGSTGKPKRVDISYDNLTNHQANIASYFSIDCPDKILQFCSISFDVSVEEILSAVTHSATLVLYDRAEQTDSHDLNQCLIKHKISFMNVPTTLWVLWLDIFEQSPQAFSPHLKTVIIGSEACPPASLQRWASLDTKNAKLYNAYGLTETTITNAIYRCPENLSLTLNSVPIGQAIGNNQLFVLDQSRRICQESQEGELVIVGPQICDTQLAGNLASRSKAVTFLSDFGNELTGLLTGDIARLDENGDFCIVGRQDSQIKINGFRINLNTIASVFARSPLVGRCAVLMLPIGHRQQLVVYFESSQKISDVMEHILPVASQPAIAAIVAQCASQLPDYALPKFFCQVEQFKLTLNDKIDTKALPGSMHTPVADHKAPAEVTNKAVVDIAESLLGTGLVWQKLSFVELGGDSISAQQLQLKAKKKGFLIDLKLLLSRKALVDVIRDAKPYNVALTTRVNKLNKLPNEQLPKQFLLNLFKDFPRWQNIAYIRHATPSQAQMLYHSGPEYGEGNLIEQVEGYIEINDLSRFKKAWLETIAAHAGLRTGFQRYGQSQWFSICYVATSLDWRVENADMLDVSKKLLKDRMLGFEYLDRPPMRFWLSQTGLNTYHFSWTYHHALMDGWSDIMVLDEVFSRYDDPAFSALAPTDDSASASYLELVYKQSVAPNVTQYWHQYLSGAAPFHVCSMPSAQVQKVLPEHPSGEAELCFSISPSIVKRTLERAKLDHLTLSNFCHLATARAIHELTGEDEVVLGSVQSSRACNELIDHNTVGLFINLVPIRIRFDAKSLDSDLAHGIQSDTLNHQHYVDGFINHPSFYKSCHLTFDSLFDTAVVVENIPDSIHEKAGKLTSHAQSGMPLTLYFWPSQGCLTVQIKYRVGMIEHKFTKNLLKKIKKVFEKS